MFIESIFAGTVVHAFIKANQSIEMDAKALEKTGKAFTKEFEANLLINQKKIYADKRLTNVAKKKRAVISTSIPMFVDVYGKIQKINLEMSGSAFELTNYNADDKNNILTSLDIVPKKEFTDKELVVGILTKGIPGMMVEDSKRNLSAARSQLSASEALYSQASSIGAFYDAIAERSDRIAKLITNMNMLFLGSIGEAEKLIEKNGTDVRNYSRKEKETLMMCVNMAVAMTDIIKIPVLDEDGELSKAAIDMINTGESYIERINEEINS